MRLLRELFRKPSRVAGRICERSGARLGLAVLVIGGFLAVAAGCGPNQGNQCPDECAYGVCDEATGQCVNESTCSADGGGMDDESGSDCLRGYSCVDGSCEADQSCDSDNPCARGTCQQGACVNPDACETRTDCAEGYRCGEDGTCVEDGCEQVDCDRGVCQGGECVNRDSCPSEEGETPACLEDHTCFESECRDDEELCEALDCERGICDIDQEACVNADDCEGDGECTEGYYCTDEGNCEENACDEERTVCGRGTCDPVTAECTNPDSCEASDECLPMHACVNNECVPESEKCGEEGCPGTMLCEYDADALDATCVEHPSLMCRNALDCRDDRVCEAGDCTAPGSCTNDGFEPNDGSGQATDYLENANGDAILASICSGDTDVYSFDTDRDPDFRGRFLLDLEYAAPDVGIGDLTVRVIDDQGETWVEKTAGREGRVSIDRTFGADRGGVYTIEIEDAGDVGEPGIDYTLFTDIVGADVTEACETAEKLEGTNVSGDTYEASSIAVGASCLKDADETPEKIYSFEIDERSYVEVDANPEDNFDISVALRSRCAVPATETSCADANTFGEGETVEGKLEPGTYYVVVQGAEAGETGEFNLNYRQLPASCTDADNHCVGSDRLKQCGPEAQQMVEQDCDFGCNQTRGACKRISGDVCRKAIDASGGLQRDLTWSNYRDDFNPGPGSCLPGNSPDADGPDAVFRVPIPDGYVMTADLDASSTQAGSLYVLSRCENSTSFCEQGADTESTTEQLDYQNQTGAEETVYLVADSASGTTGVSSIDIQLSELVCSPGERSCQNGDVYACNGSGTELSEEQSCPFGCQNAQCKADACGSAFDVGSGGTWQFDPDSYSDDYALGRDSCLGTQDTGPDLVFDVDVPAGEVLEAKVDDNGSYMDAGIYLVSDCSSTQTHANTCVVASQATLGGEESVAYRNGSSQTESLSIVVETRYENQSSNGNWTLDVDVQSPNCTPGDTSCLDGQTLQYCGQYGLDQNTYTCGGSSSSCDSSGGDAACATPVGDICVDAVDVEDGDSVSGDLSGTNAIELDQGKTGQCEVSSTTDEADTIYAIELDRDDLLTASLSVSSSYAQLYLMKDCYSDQSCQEFTDAGGGDQLHYMHSSSTETVYVVVDRYASYGSSNFTLDFQVTENAVCLPGQRTCETSNTVAKCNDTGSTHDWKLNCNNGCQDGVCQQNATAANSCSSPPSVGSGTIGTLDMGGMSDEVSTTSNCAPQGSSGNDAVYEITAQAGQVITVSADPDGRGRPAIFLAQSCATGSTQGCVTGTDSSSYGDKETLSYKVPSGEGGTYYVFFDANYSFYSSDNWDIEIRVQSPICQAGQIIGCDGNNLTYCGESGVTEKSYACQGTTSPKCYNDQCDEPTGDVCVDPIRVSGDATYSGNFAGDNDVELGSGSVGSCTVNQQTDGGDTVYEIPIRQDELLTATLSTSSSYAQMYVMDDCGSGSSCETFTSAGGGDTLHYLSDRGETIYLVVDAWSTTSMSYSLDIELTANAVCKPGESRCSSGSAEVCADDGKSYNTFSCSSGCSNGRCQYSASDVDTCGSAPSLTKGTVAEIDMSGVSNNVDLPSGSCIDGTPGNDAAFAVDASAGEVITASATPGTGDEPAIYIASDCSDPGQTCVAAANASSPDEETTVAYNVPSGASGTYYVFFDASDGTYDTSTDWDIEVHVRNPICTPDDILGCTTSGEALEYCGEHGLQKKTYSCSTTASPKCQNGACVNPSGATCFEPIPAQDGDSKTGSFGGSNELELAKGEVDDCRINRSTDDGETFYEVDLAAGELLEAELTTSDRYAQIYVTDNCRDNEVCSAFTQAPNGGDVSYYAESNETVYVVVDAYSTYASGSYTVDFSIDSSANCAPNTSTCQSSDVDVCTRSASGYDTFACGSGCTDGACDFSASDIDTCSSAPDIQSGTKAEIDMSQLNDYVSEGSNCVSKGSGGREAVFTVQAQAGETIKVDAIPGGYDDPAIYLAQSCSSGSTQSCVAGSDTESFMEQESLSYTVPSGAGGTYVVFLDSYRTTYSSEIWDVIVRVD